MKGANIETRPARGEGGTALRFAHRVRPLGPPAGAPAPVEVSVVLDDAGPGHDGGAALLRAGARFLIDAAHGLVAPAELAQMIARFACAAHPGRQAVEVALRSADGPPGTARVRCPDVEVEVNGFGAAHVLHENAVLGLYVLEVAPGRTIPAHFHRVMQEVELVLDPGLVQQGRPVSPGDAFVWPAGHVHAYANPTDTPRRILCIDRPKFIPEDEVLVPGPAELVALAPARNYLA